MTSDPDYQGKVQSIRMSFYKVRVATDCNDHIGALITLAVSLNHKPALTALKACHQIRATEMQVHDDLSSIVDRWRGHLLRHVEIHYPSLLTEVKRLV